MVDYADDLRDYIDTRISEVSDELADYRGDMGRRLSRIEGGIVVIGFLIPIAVALADVIAHAGRP